MPGSEYGEGFIPPSVPTELEKKLMESTLKQIEGLEEKLRAFAGIEGACKVLELCIADPIGDKSPQAVVIKITKKLPLPHLSDAEAFYRNQADLFVDAITHSLPSGTRMRIIKRMLAHEIGDRGFFRGL